MKVGAQHDDVIRHPDDIGRHQRALVADLHFKREPRGARRSAHFEDVTGPHVNERVAAAVVDLEHAQARVEIQPDSVERRFDPETRGTGEPHGRRVDADCYLLPDDVLPFQSPAGCIDALLVGVEQFLDSRRYVRGNVVVRAQGLARGQERTAQGRDSDGQGDTDNASVSPLHGYLHE